MMHLFAAAASSGSSEPAIELFGVHLDGAAAIFAFIVSGLSICGSIVTVGKWGYGKIVPIKLHAYVCDEMATIEDGKREAALKVDVFNRGSDVRKLSRFSIRFDPGWRKRLKPRWHHDDSKATVSWIFDNGDPTTTPLACGWGDVRTFVNYDGTDPKALVVIAGFGPKQVRTRKVKAIAKMPWTPETLGSVEPAPQEPAANARSLKEP